MTVQLRATANAARRRATACMALAGALLAPAAHAAFVYTYTGGVYTDVLPANNGPYTTAMNLTGSFTLDVALAPNQPVTNVLAQATAFSFFDGVNTIDSGNADGSFNIMSVGTGAGGEIIAFDILLDTGYAAPVTVGDHRNTMHISSFGTWEAQAIVWQCLGLSGNSTCGGELEVQSGRSHAGLRVGIWSAQADANAISEPGSWPLAGLALGALFGLRRSSRLTLRG